MLQPYIKRGRVAEWYGGTADAVLQNINVVEHGSGDTVLILAGDHIYKMDYQPFLAAHRRKRADVTIAVRRVPLAEASRMGVLALDDQDRVVEWQEKPKQPKSDLASMGVYVFSKRALNRWLSEERKDFGRDVIPAMLEGGARVFGYRFDGYWQDVGTIQSYWEANMALLEDNPELDLYDREWLIHTRSEERAPAKIGPDGPGPPEPDLARLRDQRDGRQQRPVARRAGGRGGGGPRLDHHVRHRRSGPARSWTARSSTRRSSSAQTAIVGDGPDYDTPNRQEPGRLNTGITVVGKQSIVPRGVRLGRNVKVGERVKSADFANRVGQVRRHGRAPAGRGEGGPPRRRRTSHRRGSSRASPTDDGAGRRRRRTDRRPRAEPGPSEGRSRTLG